MKKSSWFANGKLLITGEYLVLVGAKALALPLNLGQYLKVAPCETGILKWEAKSPEGTWFKVKLKLPKLDIIETTNQVYANRLLLLLQEAINLSEHFLKDNHGLEVVTELDFNPEYGFGSSSTLIYCLSKWARIDPYKLQQQSFGGSGFDIACADAEGPITFQRDKEDFQIQNVKLSESISNHLYFVYLGKKQQTSQSIREFRKNALFTSSDIDTITSITNEVIATDSLDEFERMITEHEKLMSQILKTPTVKSSCFSNYEGCIKSLGAWGGDFILVSSHLPKHQFSEQMNGLGFHTSFSYADLARK